MSDLVDSVKKGSTESDLWFPKLKFMATFGLSQSSVNNVVYAKDAVIAYPCSNAIVLNDYATKEQEFMQLGQTPNQVDRLALSHDREYLAVAERGLSLRIFVFSLETRQMKKLLCIPFKEIRAKRFAALEFSCNGLLLAIVGEPDYELMQFSWKEGKITSRVPLADADQSINNMAVNPCDPCRLAVIGNGLYRELTFANFCWKAVGPSHLAKRVILLDADWLNEEQLAAGTDDGRIVIFESSFVRCYYVIEDLYEFSNPPLTREQEIQWVPKVLNSEQMPQEFRDGEHMVRNVVAFNKGLAISYRKSVIIVFHQTDKYSFVRANTYDIACFGCNYINSLAVNPSGNYLTLTTDTYEFFGGKLFERQESHANSIILKTYTYGSHKGSISQVSIASWKPILLTVGSKDNCIRIWNPMLKKLLHVKKFNGLYSGCIHPTGLLCAISVENHIQLSALTISGLEKIWRADVKAAPYCQFSNNGHQLGIITSSRTTVLIYSILEGVLIHSVEDIRGGIMKFVFTSSDGEMWTVSSNGYICQWVIRSEFKLVDIETNDVGNFDICCAPDGGTAYVACSDGYIREIKDGVVSRLLFVNQKSLNTIEIAHSGCMLFAAGEQNTIIIVRYPIVEPNEFKEFIFHKHTITNLQLEYHDRLLISTSIRGTLCLWNVIYSKIPDHRDIIVNQILVTIKDISDWEAKKREYYRKITEHNEQCSIMLQASSEYYSKMMCVKARRLDQDTKRVNEKARSVKRKFNRMSERLHNELETKYEGNRQAAAKAIQKIIVKIKKEGVFARQLNEKLTVINMDIEKIDQHYEEEMQRAETKMEEAVNTTLDHCSRLINIMLIKQIRDSKRGEQARRLIEKDGESEIRHLRSRMSRDQVILDLKNYLVWTKITRLSSKMRDIKRLHDERLEESAEWAERNRIAKVELIKLRAENDQIEIDIKGDQEKLKELKRLEGMSGEIYKNSRKISKASFFLSEHTRAEIEPIERAITVYTQDKAELQNEILRLSRILENAHIEVENTRLELTQRTKYNKEMATKCKHMSSKYDVLLEDIIRMSTIHNTKVFAEAFRIRLLKLKKGEEDDYLKMMEDEIKKCQMEEIRKAKMEKEMRKRKPLGIPSLRKKKRKIFTATDLLIRNRCLMAEVRKLRSTHNALVALRKKISLPDHS